MIYSIHYGIENNTKDITSIALKKCLKNNIIYIPSGDVERSLLFNDEYYQKMKIIKFYDANGLSRSFSDEKEIYYDLTTNIIYTQTSVPSNIKELFNNFKTVEKHTKITSKLSLENYNNFAEEYMEQLLAIRYLKGDESVLELGGNIGRNSCVIASILNRNNNSNLVTFECCKEYAEELERNRDRNNLKFNVENSALSKRRLLQRFWDTIPSDIDIEGYTPVKSMSFEELENKYNIKFNTLILDCEGAFYYILQDMPNILDNVKLIIMENDYSTEEQMNFVHNSFYSKGFKLDYHSPHPFAGTLRQCFYTVFVKE